MLLTDRQIAAICQAERVLISATRWEQDGVP